MKRKWWLVPFVLALIGVLWILTSDQPRLEPLRAAIGLKPASVERAKSKPICGTVVNPNVAAPTDCIPQYVANLPPDPGAAGKATIEGVDSDKDGVRDDVQRFIALNWGASERAFKTLTVVAKSAQMQAVLGDSLGREESMQRMPVALASGTCYALTATPEMLTEGAMEKVQPS